MTPPLACTVRGCGLVLERQGRTLTCARRHSYDVARSGYVNLLQPTDRRSRHAGDSAQAIAARSRLLERGVGSEVLSAVAERAAALVPDGGTAADLGSGSGELLAELRKRRRVIAVGIDLSTAAADHAARRSPEVTWIVANADRRLPLLDRSIDLIVSVHGRRNPAECARVLTRAGRMVVAIPAPDDLLELRTLTQGRASKRERVTSLASEYERWFTVAERFEVRRRYALDNAALRDVLCGTYRGARKSTASRLEALDRLDVTLASLVVVFQPV